MRKRQERDQRQLDAANTLIKAGKKGEVAVYANDNPHRDDPEYKDEYTEILKKVREQERKGDIPFKVDPGYKTGGTVMCRGNGRARTRPTKLR